MPFFCHGLVVGAHPGTYNRRPRCHPAFAGMTIIRCFRGGALVGDVFSLVDYYPKSENSDKFGQLLIFGNRINFLGGIIQPSRT